MIVRIVVVMTVLFFALQLWRPKFNLRIHRRFKTEGETFEKGSRRAGWTPSNALPKS